MVVWVSRKVTLKHPPNELHKNLIFFAGMREAEGMMIGNKEKNNTATITKKTERIKVRLLSAYKIYA